MNKEYLKGLKFSNFVFTLNNYTEQHIVDLHSFAATQRYLVYGKEIAPMTGTPHLQGYVELTTRATMSKIKKDMKIDKIWIKKREKTARQAATYCKKPETPLEDIFEFGTISQQGRRKNIDEIKSEILAGKRLKDVILGPNISNFQDMRIAEKFAQYTSRPRCKDNPPKVIWLYGETGAGKTKYVYDNHTDIYTTMDTYQWWDGYEQQEVILIDDMRRDFCKFHTLLRLLDRYPHKVQIKGGSVEINSPIIYITSPFSPKQLWSGREDIHQLLRRITEVKELKLP